jgi:hypothetical protein
LENVAMNKRLLPPHLPMLLLCAALAACTSTENLYPVAGPLSAREPVPVFPARVQGIVAGRLDLVLDGGESCQGSWSRVARAAPAEAAAQDLSILWDGVYGPGYFANVVSASTNYARAALTGDRGTVVRIEFFQPVRAVGRRGPGGIVGVAMDSDGNVFRLSD